MSRLTLLDIAKRTGSDPAIGLVEEILLVAPELRTLPTVPKSGTSYSISRRTGRPRGAFRSANEGVTPGKSAYEKIDVPMFFFDGQMVVDESIVKADKGELGDILAQEGAGQLQDNSVVLGDQIYRGTVADAKGFRGFKQNLTAAMTIDATGVGAATHTAYAVYEDERAGVHLPVGMDGFMSLGEWMKQQVVDDTDAAKRYMAYVNNLSFYIGLAFGSAYCLGAVKNITAAKPLTDQLGNECVNTFKVGRKPTRWFMSREAVLGLQNTRSALGMVATDGKGTGGFSPRPTELAGVPIVETDSIATIAAF